MVAGNGFGGTADGSHGAVQLGAAEFDGNLVKGGFHCLHQCSPPGAALGRHLAHHAVDIDDHVSHQRSGWRKRRIQNQSMHVSLQVPGYGTDMCCDVD